jgi:hypothetical protein
MNSWKMRNRIWRHTRMLFRLTVIIAHGSIRPFYCRTSSGDPSDLWDFNTSYSKYASLVKAKGERPPTPLSASTTPEELEAAMLYPRSRGSPQQKLSDDQYLDTYPAQSKVLPQALEKSHLEDSSHDRTVLDSVVLPVISSVSCHTLPWGFNFTDPSHPLHSSPTGSPQRKNEQLFTHFNMPSRMLNEFCQAWRRS